MGGGGGRPALSAEVCEGEPAVGCEVYLRDGAGWGRRLPRLGHHVGLEGIAGQPVVEVEGFQHSPLSCPLFFLFLKFTRNLLHSLKKTVICRENIHIII
jgi:hypothetical protein